MGKAIEAARAAMSRNPLAKADADQTFRRVFCYIEAAATLGLLTYAAASLVALGD